MPTGKKRTEKRSSLLKELRELEDEEHIEPVEIALRMEHIEYQLVDQAIRLDRRRLKRMKKGDSYIV